MHYETLEELRKAAKDYNTIIDINMSSNFVLYQCLSRFMYVFNALIYIVLMGLRLFHIIDLDIKLFQIIFICVVLIEVVSSTVFRRLYINYWNAYKEAWSKDHIQDWDGYDNLEEWQKKQVLENMAKDCMGYQGFK